MMPRTDPASSERSMRLRAGTVPDVASDGKRDKLAQCAVTS